MKDPEEPTYEEHWEAEQALMHAKEMNEDELATLRWAWERAGYAIAEGNAAIERAMRGGLSFAQIRETVVPSLELGRGRYSEQHPEAKP
jgi:hypothetical protein